jgi:RNase P/RNase MRP subunit p29
MRIVPKRFARMLLAPAVFATTVMAAQVVHAQAPAQPTGIRGTIVALNADTLKVHSNAGQDLDVTLAKDTPIRGVTLANISDIKPGSYVGTAAVPQADGTLKALEVHVFPPSMAGSGDGHRPWDLGKNSSMTNGTVGDLVVSNGRTMTVKYKNGEKKVVVPDDVPVVNLEAGDRSLLVPGAHVVLFAKKGPDGALSALFISAGEKGVTPPM